MSGQGTVKVYTYPNMIVRVYTPDLSPEERASRMKKIKQSAEDLIIAAMKVKK